MRFLVDACVDVRVAAWLRGQGHDAVHLSEQGLQRLADGDIFRKAVTEDRCVLTFDLDFSEIAASSIVFPRSSQNRQAPSVRVR